MADKVSVHNSGAAVVIKLYDYVTDQGLGYFRERPYSAITLEPGHNNVDPGFIKEWLEHNHESHLITQGIITWPKQEPPPQ
jgi:hypothetical protein